MAKSAIKDTNFNMRINKQKKAVKMPRYNKETEMAMQETRDIMSGKVSAKSYSSSEELFAELEK